jgi:hypothetical protein
MLVGAEQRIARLASWAMVTFLQVRTRVPQMGY